MKYNKKPYRIRKKKSVFRIFKNRYLWLSFLGLALAGGIFYLLFFFPKLQIKEIKIAGCNSAPCEEIKKMVDSKIANRILFFPSKSILFADLKKIKSGILARYPQIEKVSAKRDFPDSLALEIQERTAKTIWCFRDSPCFNLDGNGVIFSFSSDSIIENPIIKNFEKSSEPVLGEKVAEPELFVLVGNIGSRLKEINISSKEFILLAAERLNVKTQQNWHIYLDPKENLDWQLTKLKAVLENEIPAERRQNLEYIDVRFGNLAPYKYR